MNDEYRIMNIEWRTWNLWTFMWLWYRSRWKSTIQRSV